MLNKTISRSYAIAAFNFAKKNDVIFVWYNMLNFSSKLSIKKKMKNVVLGILGKKKSEKIFVQICKDYIDDNFCNFIKILNENNQLYLLPEIKILFYEYWKKSKNITTATVYSNKLLSKSFIKHIYDFIKINFSKRIFLKNILDKSITHGFIIKIDDKIFDNSFDCYLNKLKKYLFNEL
ncbi:ATP synthase F1 subunit delta [Buchnera aphidicola (Ceratoglyphina bambusae)]|uniref:ATP synthase F1 subunit delta n=1 Tax=Buchnera aphidicola TaxID=9 RepID=UPI0031B804E3